MSNEELMLVKGGGLTGTILNALSRAVTTIFELGQAFGSSLRRAISGKSCKA